MAIKILPLVKPDPDAIDVDFDDTECGLGADNVQGAIEELCDQLGTVSASPGYSFGREGAHADGTWLIATETASNKRGLPFGLLNGFLRQVVVSTSNVPSAFDVEVYYHDGDLSGSTLITTVTTAGTASTETFSLNVSVPADHQLAVKINNTGGTKPQETGVFLVLRGDLQ